MQFENRDPLKSFAAAGARGCGQCCTITLLHINRLNKTESAIFVSLMCSLLPQDLFFIFFFIVFSDNIRLDISCESSSRQNSHMHQTLHVRKIRVKNKSVVCRNFAWLFYEVGKNRWMTCDFTSFLSVFQSYQDDVRMIMKGCVQWNSVYS